MYDIPSAYRNETVRGGTYIVVEEAKRPAKIKVCAMVSRER